jgi:hypothetical protein
MAVLAGIAVSIVLSLLVVGWLPGGQVLLENELDD